MPPILPLLLLLLLRSSTSAANSLHFDLHYTGRRACESAPDPTGFETPLFSAAYAGSGQYLAKFHLGTPAQRFALVVDTGSDLTWVKCGRINNGGERRVFEASKSRTFRPVGCSSELCKATLPFSLLTCPATASPCLYDYVYADGSSAKGVYARESATIIQPNGLRSKLHNIIVGCTSTSVGSAFTASDGVLGLGYSNSSFAKIATSRFQGKFSYCLVDHLSPKNVSSRLVFGPTPQTNGVRYADLVLSTELEPFYAINVIGISIGNEMLNISSDVWNVEAKGGVILDSGSSLTSLAKPAYKAVTGVLSRVMDRFYDRIDVKPFEFCYNVKAKTQAVVPKLVFHVGGYKKKGIMKFAPPQKSYVVDVADGVKCLGFLEAVWPGTSTVGNILQQNHLWEFDVGKRRLGFRRSNCAGEW